VPSHQLPISAESDPAPVFAAHPVTLSTVIPVYRGERYLSELVAALAAVRTQLRESGIPLVLTEAIFVDDAAIDRSPSILDDLAGRNSWVRVVHLSRNYGQHPASIAGILHSSGDWVATLDEDLQHHPRDLLELLRHAVSQSLDVVYARPKAQVHRSLFRDQGSRLFKGLVARITTTPHARDFNSFRLIRGSIARAAAAVAGYDTYLDAALGWFTARTGALPLDLLDQRYIVERSSGYGVRSLVEHGRRMALSAEPRILRLASATGFFAVSAALLTALGILGIKLFAPHLVQVGGWTSLILVTLFFGGLTTFLVGMVLEFLAPLALQAKGKPTFFVVDRSRDEGLRAALEALARECSS
jgi:polyisoprenyl-phosphate glycosyltransferase